MTDARYTVYIDKAYRNYVSTHENFEWTDDFCKENLKDYGDQWDVLTHEEFTNNCQTDDDFANRWGCKIVIKELSLEERVDIFNKKKEYGEVILPEFKSVGDMNAWTNKLLEEVIPTKLITVVYTEKIESYV